MPQTFILDEWIIHDLAGENGEENRREAYTFLEKLVRKCDKIAVLLGSPFLQKAYSILMKSRDVTTRKMSKFFFRAIIYDSKKCILLRHVKRLPEELEDKVPKDDQYLYQIQLATQGTIITTDKELQKLPNTKPRTHIKNYDP